MDILNFPTELLLLVAENLSLGDLSRFRSTSRQICLLLTPRFEKLCLQDVGDLTALQWASVRGHAGLIRLAVSNGVEIEKPLQGRFVEITRHIPKTPDFNLLCYVKILWDLSYRSAAAGATGPLLCTPLFLATYCGHAKAIEVLLELGASMQCFGAMGTPAHIPASRGDVGCVQVFIGANVDISAKGFRGNTILHQAISGGIEMVMYLLQLEGGKDLINVGSDDGQTPLHFAVRDYDSSSKRRGIIELLLQYGADVHAKAQDGSTPAHIAARLGIVSSMRVLIAAGIDFYARDHSGQTILHHAIGSGKRMLKYLLEQEGGRKIIHVGDNQGHTPLDYAERLGEREAVQWLVKYGAKRVRLFALPFQHSFCICS